MLNELECIKSIRQELGTLYFKHAEYKKAHKHLKYRYTKVQRNPERLARMDAVDQGLLMSIHDLETEMATCRYNINRLKGILRNLLPTRLPIDYKVKNYKLNYDEYNQILANKISNQYHEIWSSAEAYQLHITQYKALQKLTSEQKQHIWQDVSGAYWYRVVYNVLEPTLGYDGTVLVPVENIQELPGCDSADMVPLEEFYGYMTPPNIPYYRWVGDRI